MHDDIEHFLLPALEHKSKKRKSLFGFLSIGRYENHIVIGKYKILKNYKKYSMLEQKEIKSRAITSDKLQQKDIIYNESSSTAKHDTMQKFFPAS